MAENFVVTNVDASTSWRTKFFSSMLQEILHTALVSEKIFNVDRSNTKLIYNPYSSASTVEITTLTGTYTPAAYTTTNDTLTVGTEFKVGEHVYAFERVMNNYNMVAERFKRQAIDIAVAIDKYNINLLCEDATGTYTTPAGGFTVGANVPVIISNLASKVMGFSGVDAGMYLVIENTDVPGFIQAQLTSGFSYADSALNNGFMTSYAGVDIYVVRSGTFENATYVGTDTTSITNSGHRVFGIKNTATYAQPQDIVYEEIQVSGKTGRELRSYGLFGFKLWAQNAGLNVDITLA